MNPIIILHAGLATGTILLFAGIGEIFAERSGILNLGVEGMMLLGLRAAAWGLPFIPTQVGLGTDIVTVNPGIKVIESPYDDKEWVAMPALRLDASLIHVDRADNRGVCPRGRQDLRQLR